MNIIIFSKDRACQLDLLLRSIKRYFIDWQQLGIHILYTYSDNRFRQGYEILVKEYRNEFHFLEQTNFKKNTLELIENSKLHTMFLVDDDVFKTFFEYNCDEIMRFINDPNILTLSLRLCPRLTYCYMLNKDMRMPNFNVYNEWFWQDQEADWCYPMSLDGHIFRTKEIKTLLETTGFSNPNELEANISAHPFRHLPKMSCFQESKIVNIVANVVNTSNVNRCGNLIDTKDLNDKYINGDRIVLEKISANKSCHMITGYNFYKT